MTFQTNKPIQNTVLVVAASRHGSTAEIAARIGHQNHKGALVLNAGTHSGL